MQPFTHKYTAKNTKEIVGQDESIAQLKNFIASFPKGRKKSALLYGPSGTGKTCSAYSIANELNYEIFETNASEFRNADQVNDKVGNAIKQRSTRINTVAHFAPFNLWLILLINSERRNTPPASSKPVNQYSLTFIFSLFPTANTNQNISTSNVPVVNNILIP